jgi:hypothetical protein
VRRRASAGFADAYTDPRHRELGKAPRERGERGHAAPHEQREADDRAPRAAVRPARDGDAEERVEQRERQAGEQAQRRVRELELLLDVLLQDREDLPVDEVQHVDEHEQTDHVVAVARRERLRVRGLRLHTRARHAFGRHLPAMLSERAGASQPFVVSW